jgi:hypothetical protein
MKWVISHLKQMNESGVMFIFLVYKSATTSCFRGNAAIANGQSVEHSTPCALQPFDIGDGTKVTAHWTARGTDNHKVDWPNTARARVACPGAAYIPRQSTVDFLNLWEGAT